MTFISDPNKARINQRDHKVGFDLAQEVWKDPFHIIAWDRFIDGEERWHAIGMVGQATLLLVVHTYPGDGERIVRIVSARRATSFERRRYEQDGV